MKYILSFLIVAATVQGRTLHVGTAQEYSDPASACSEAIPGDTVFIHNGVYVGTFMVRNLHGTEDEPIVIIGESQAGVVFRGGTEALHFSDCSYLHIERFTVTGQTGNGVNIDDGGSIESPAHHIIVRNVVFEQMGASGNNDFLKLSGLDHFRIETCSFSNGATGGSGVDMVGCHHGVIVGNTFESMGSNCIQAKGGTQNVRIERNWFRDGGQRSVNLGGSTGLEFFRPLDAPFEAADLQVYTNVFEGSVAPIAYVGCVRVDVANNLIRSPERWAFRILQETTQPAGRFAACGDNWFRNNVVIYAAGQSPMVNIGPNTAPETFRVNNNLWYNGTASTMLPTAGLPFTETNSIAGSNPLIGAECPTASSPVIAKGEYIHGLQRDLYGKQFGIPPSIGACEVGSATNVAEPPHLPESPCVRLLGWGEQGAMVHVDPHCSPCLVRSYDLLGRLLGTVVLEAGIHIVPGVWNIAERVR